MYFHGSGIPSHSAPLVGCSASNFADSARTLCSAWWPPPESLCRRRVVLQTESGRDILTALSLYNTRKGTMHSIVNRIQRACVIYGMVATFRLFVAIAFQSISRFVSSLWSARSITENHDLEFDLKWGVDTGGTVVPEKSEVIGPNWIYGIKYQGCNSDDLDQALTEIDTQHECFTFVDFGSGKGRGILTASRFPFRKIIGVEYSERLNEIARHNVLLFPDSAKKCKDIEVVCADAIRFPIPEGPLVIFLFCPFLRPVMTQVVQNVSTSFHQNPRRIVVLYFNPLFADVWKKAIFMKETRPSKNVAIYDTQIGVA